MGIQDSPEFWIRCRGFQIPDAVLCFRFQWNLDSGFQPLVGPGLVELYLRFQRLGFRIPIGNISGFRIPQAKFFGSRDQDSLAWSDVVKMSHLPR